MSDLSSISVRHQQLIRDLFTNEPNSDSVAEAELRSNRDEFGSVLAVAFISLLSYRFESQPPTRSQVRDLVRSLGETTQLPASPMKVEALIRGSTIDPSLGQELAHSEDVPTLQLKVARVLALTPDEAETDIDALMELTEEVSSTVQPMRGPA